MTDARDIESITFGILSSEEIKAMAVCKIDSTKLTGPNSVYDERMGSLTENNENCVTCGMSSKMCPGHFGYVELYEYILHPLFIKMTAVFLKCFCKHCYRLVVHSDQIKLWGYHRVKGEKKFMKILEKLEKVDICCHCQYPQPKVIFKSKEDAILLEYKQKITQEEKGSAKTGKISIVLSVEEIKKIFDNVQDEDVSLLGFNPELMHPKSLVMTVFPALPPCARPWIKTDGNICDDDLTTQIVEIVKDNIKLRKLDEEGGDPKRKQKLINSLKFHISTFYNNCVAPETPILMWDGSVQRADKIKVGDVIIGDDGNQRNVLAICNGEDQMYEITQDKGDTYTVNSKHILTLKFSGHKSVFWTKPNTNSPLGSWWMKWYDPVTKKLRNKIVSVTVNRSEEQAFQKINQFASTIKYGNTFDIPVKEYLSLQPHVRRCFMGFKLSRSINWPRREVFIDPYILGMWLGDGNRDGKGFTSADTELVDSWREWASENNSDIVLHTTKDRDDIYFGIRSSDNRTYPRSEPAPFKKLLAKYDLVKNKHIPNEYIVNDEKTRLELLAGLIDTDGHVSFEGSNITIAQSTEHRPILNGALQIARSVGLQATITSKKSSWTWKGVSKTGNHLVLHISGGIEKIPTRLVRKKCNNSKRNTLTSKISVKCIGVGKYSGFSVDSNHRFILGDYTVTHNSKGKAKHPTDNQPIKGLKERLTSKEGQIRQNHMGKRVDFSARTVIGPDPSLKMGQMAIPVEVSQILTFPEVVTPFNIDRLSNVVNDNKANFVLRNNGETRINLKYAMFRKGTELFYGDIIVRDCETLYENEDGSIAIPETAIKVTHGGEKLQVGDRVVRNGKLLEGVKFPTRKRFTLRVGDVVERHLTDGDIVLLNRQPTLHKGSMLAKEVVVKPYKTFRMNLATTKSFNADFDGDEIDSSLEQQTAC